MENDLKISFEDYGEKSSGGQHKNWREKYGPYLLTHQKPCWKVNKCKRNNVGKISFCVSGNVLSPVHVFRAALGSIYVTDGKRFHLD